MRKPFMRRGQPNRDRGPGDWVSEWAVPVLAVITAGAAPILWDLAPEHARTTSPYFYLFLLCSALAVVSVIAQGTLGSRKSVAIRKSVADYNHKLTDTIRALQRLIQSNNDDNARRAFFDSIVSEAKSLMPLEAARICVYDLEAIDTGEDEEQQLYLRLASHGGRGDLPRTEFTSETPHGEAAIAVATGTALKCVDDPSKEGDSIHREPNALWESFLAVPIRSGSRPLGMVTIDTTRKTQFTSDHQAVALTIGKFIELGLSSVAEAAADPKPELSDLLVKLGEGGAGHDPARQPSSQPGAEYDQETRRE